jgi:hypothetical protein
MTLVVEATAKGNPYAVWIFLSVADDSGNAVTTLTASDVSARLVSTSGSSGFNASAIYIPTTAQYPTYDDNGDPVVDDNGNPVYQTFSLMNPVGLPGFYSLVYYPSPPTKLYSGLIYAVEVQVSKFLTLFADGPESSGQTITGLEITS